jgi:hypothetical protein
VKRTALIFVFSAVLYVLMLSSCGTPVGPTLTATPSPTATLPPGQEPIEVLSVMGPLPAWYEDGKPVYNPGGPVVELTLRNNSAEPIVFLEATLQAESISGHPFLFSFFGIYPAHPLLPSEVTSTKSIFITGGFANDIPYPLTIKGTLQNNVAFSYTKSVVITHPEE